MSKLSLAYKTPHGGDISALAGHPAAGAEVLNLACIKYFLLGALTDALCQRELLHPDACVGEYLPELRCGPYSPGDHIQLKHLLNHTVGYFPIEARSWEDFADALTREPAPFPPGLTVHYRGPELFVLLEVIRRRTGVSPRHLLQEYVLDPIDAVLRTSASCRGPNDFDLNLSLPELVDVVSFVLSASSMWGSAFMARASERWAYVNRDARLRFGRQPAGYSLGLSIFCNALVGANGSSEGHSVGLRFPSDGGFVLAGSTTAHSSRRDLGMADVCAALGYPTPDGEPRSIIGALGDLNPADMIGRYRSGGGWAIEVFVDDDDVHGLVFRNHKMQWSFQGSVFPDGLLIGGHRWSGANVEFFRHPLSGQPALNYGGMAFAAA